MIMISLISFIVFPFTFGRIFEFNFEINHIKDTFFTCVDNYDSFLQCINPDWINAVGSVATTFALIFIILQYKHGTRQIDLLNIQTQNLREEMEFTLRPWIGLEKGIVVDSNGAIRISLMNYGRTPAFYNMQTVISHSEIRLKEILERDTESDNTRLLVLLPNARQSPNITATVDRYKNEFTWIAILLRYKFNAVSSFKGQYTGIWKFEKITGNVELVEEDAK